MYYLMPQVCWWFCFVAALRGRKMRLGLACVGCIGSETVAVVEQQGWCRGVKIADELWSCCILVICRYVILDHFLLSYSYVLKESLDQCVTCTCDGPNGKKANLEPVMDLSHLTFNVL